MSRDDIKIGVVFWDDEDEIGTMILDTIDELGCKTNKYLANSVIQGQLDVVLTYGPFGSLVPITNQLLAYPESKRPLFVLWMTEQFPNPDIPEWIKYTIGNLRSWLERKAYRQHEQGIWQQRPQLQWMTNTLHRYRYYGDLYWLQREGILSILAIASPWTRDYLRNLGFSPIEAYPGFRQEDDCSDIDIQRDIPVLWIGKVGSSRRGQILKFVRDELRKRDIEIFMVDGVENPYAFGEDRTILLNRTKIVLNILRQKWDDNSFRYCLAAWNRALIVSEPTLRHTPFIPGKHLVELDVEQIADGISYYLSHEDELQHIVDQAYQLVTSKMTMHQGVNKILDQVELLRIGMDFETLQPGFSTNAQLNFDDG